MNILAGLYRPDEGEIRVDGRPVVFRSPRDAIEAGLGMVHQHFTLVPSQTVTENILLGLDQPRFLLDARRSEAEVARLAARVRPAGPSPSEGLAAQRRRAAAGRDPEAALSRRPDPHPRRADRGPRAAGDRGPVPDAEGDDRGRPERRLHQPQAQRGRRDRRPDHGHAPRPGDGAGPAGGGRDEARPGPAHGRAGPLRARTRRRRSRRATCCSRRRTSRPRTTAGCRPFAACRSTSAPARSSGIAAVAGNGQTRARRGDHRPPAAAAGRSGSAARS